MGQILSSQNLQMFVIDSFENIPQLSPPHLCSQKGSLYFILEKDQFIEKILSTWQEMGNCVIIIFIHNHNFVIEKQIVQFSLYRPGLMILLGNSGERGTGWGSETAN